LFDGTVLAEVFVEGEADGLDGDVGGVGSFEEGSVGVWWSVRECDSLSVGDKAREVG